MRISEAYGLAVNKCEEILEDIAMPVDLEDRDALINACETSLSSKVISEYSSRFAPIAVDAVLGVIDPPTNRDGVRSHWFPFSGWPGLFRNNMKQHKQYT